MSGILARFNGHLMHHPRRRADGALIFRVQVEASDPPHPVVRVCLPDVLARDLEWQLWTGATVAIEGVLTPYNWTDDDGRERCSLRLVTTSCTVLAAPPAQHPIAELSHA